HVANIPHAPVAIVTGPANANEGGDNVTLDGSTSYDPDLDPITFTWQQTAGPGVTLVYGPGDTAHQMPMFVTPWVSANTPVTFKLTVTDLYGLTNSGDDSVLLRAERSGNGDGRVYRVSFKVDDPEQSASGTVKVMVPHDKKTDIAIDSGGNYDSTH